MKKGLCSLVLVSLMLLSFATACGKKEVTKPAPAEKETMVVTSLAEAKAAVEAGEYEAAYLYLLTDTSDEARKLKEKFVYVPVEVSQSQDGKVYATGRWEYDANGYLILQDVSVKPASAEDIIKAVTTKTECAWDDEGRLLTATITKNKDGNESWVKETHTYDINGNRLTIHTTYHDGNWCKYEYSYDADGNELTERYSSDGDYWYEYAYTYDADGRKVAQHYTSSVGSWSKQEYTYDGAGNLLMQYAIDDADKWTKQVYTYDTAGHMVTEEETDYCGNIKKRTYSTKKDKQGNALQLYFYQKAYTEAKAEDGTCVENGNWTETEETYDADGNALTVRKYYYDYNNPEHIGGEYTVCTYDEKGTLLTRSEYVYSDYTDWEGSVTFEDSSTFTNTYDAEGRILTQKVIRSNLVGEYGYDDVGYTYHDDGTYIMTKLAVEGESRHTLTTTYDAEHRKLVEESVAANGDWEKHTYVYRVNGYTHRAEHYEEYERANGDYRKCTFDAVGNCLTEEECVSGSRTMAVYTYDDAGNCLTDVKTNSVGEVTKKEWSYDAYGNRLSETYTKADGFRIKTVKNAAGNVLSQEVGSGGKTIIKWELRYYPDGIEQNAVFMLKDGATTATGFLQYVYDYTFGMLP